MALQEWVNEDSAEYEKIMRFNDPVHPLMHTAPGEKLDCVVDEAYAYETKDGKVVIGVVPRVQAGIYLIDKFELAGEYVINDIVAQDAVSNPTRYLIRHRQLITLDDFNHIIDLNRPDVLDPQTIFDNVDNFKGIVHQWAQHHWISDKADKLVQDLPDGHPELIDERIPREVGKGALPDHPAIKTPWERLISYHDTAHFCSRYGAVVAASMMQVYRILVPDFEKR